MAKPRETHIKDLRLDPNNARRRTPRNHGLIVDALNEVGAARSVVIDEDNVVLAGNGTLEAAGEAGITKVQIVDADGSTIIAVRRKGLTPELKRRLSLYDNRTQEFSEWDADVLRDLRESGTDLSNLFTGEELDALLSTDAPADVESMVVERPVDVAWVLLGIPIEDWPAHQATVEQLQLAAKFYTMVLRPKDADDGKPTKD
jgi:ParB-like chromosome segregation protein Spo0J